MACSVAIVLIPHASAWNFARLDPHVPKTGSSNPPHKRRVGCFRFKKRNFAQNSAEYFGSGMVVLLEASNRPPSCNGTVVVNWAPC